MVGVVVVGLVSFIDVKFIVYNLLFNGIGNGLLVFYYVFLLLLVGFIGSIVVSILVDLMFGYVLVEFGFVYCFVE